MSGPEKRWGSVARKARNVLAEDPLDRTTQARSDEQERGRRRPEPLGDVWVLDEILESTRTGKGKRAAVTGPSATPAEADGTPRRSGHRSEVAMPGDVVEELAVAVGRGDASRLAERLARAAGAYDRDRYFDALRMTTSLLELAPTSSAVRELHGLVCYRLGRFAEAIRHLEAARGTLGDDPSQLPVIMDCHRALKHHRKVEHIYKELREASASADVLVEGRLVMAASMADQGDLAAAIELLASSGAARNLQHPGDRHIRQWYVLADLYERAGDFPRARELFTRVALADPELADAAQRVTALGTPGRKPRPSAPRSESRRPRR